MTTLYKLTNSALLSWSITTEQCKVIIEHGQVGGKKQIDIINTGSYQEAVTVMDRRIEVKKTKQGYTSTKPTEVPRLPMLATKYDPTKLPDYVFVQPKLDGIRCVGSSTGMITRRGEPIKSLHHIEDALQSLPPGVRLDGELYCHGLNFQQHLSIIKRDDYHDDCKRIIYNVFDIQMPEFPFSERMKYYTDVVTRLKSPYVVCVRTTALHKNQVANLARQVYSDYEGVILRNQHSLYEFNHRSFGLQKYKFNSMDECQIIDIVAAATGREEGAAIFVCKHPTTNQTFKVRPKMDITIRKHIYSNKSTFINYWTRVTYEGLSEKGVPLKPRAEGISHTPEGLN